MHPRRVGVGCFVEVAAMSASVQFDHDVFTSCAEKIVSASHTLYQRGWSPATSSNYSLRLNADCCAITVSGKHKGELTTADVMVVNLHGEPLTPQKPSAETLLHTQLYQRDADIGAVLHTHSVCATVLTMEHPNLDKLVLRGYELLKAFPDVKTHNTELHIPIFDNTQDMVELAQRVEKRMQRDGAGVAYLIRGHGLYTWAEDMAACMRHIEALEFLLDCEWRRYAAHAGRR